MACSQDGKYHRFSYFSGFIFYELLTHLVRVEQPSFSWTGNPLPICLCTLHSLLDTVWILEDRKQILPLVRGERERGHDAFLFSGTDLLLCGRKRLSERVNIHVFWIHAPLSRLTKRVARHAWAAGLHGACSLATVSRSTRDLVWKPRANISTCRCGLSVFCFLSLRYHNNGELRYQGRFNVAVPTHILEGSYLTRSRSGRGANTRSSAGSLFPECTGLAGCCGEHATESNPALWCSRGT